MRITTKRCPTPADAVACRVDRLVAKQFQRLSTEREESSDVLAQLRALKDAPGYATVLSEPATMFPEPERVRISDRRLARHRVGSREWRWSSQHPMLFPEIEERYRAERANQRAVLRVMTPRLRGTTVAIVVNGFASGHHLIERLAWPFGTFRRYGITPALFALPFHGPRSGGLLPEWPGGELKFLFEGFRQAVWDLRVAVRGLREAGARSVGAIGMSLGGYTVALLATASSDLDFAIPYIPFASITEMMRDHDLTPGAQDDHLLVTKGFATQMRPIAPLHREPLIEPKRVAVISGSLDQLAKLDHGARLSEHFGAHHITFRGAHILQRGRARAFGEAFRNFEANGVLPKRN